MTGINFNESLIMDHFLLPASNFSSTNTSNLDCSNVSSACDSGPCFDQDLCMDEVLEYMRPKASGWILILLYGMIFVIGLVGNFLVCFAVWRNPSMRTVTNYFIVNLAVADFLVILICLPPTVIEDVAMTWFFGRIMCKIVKYLQTVSVAVSVFTLSCISLERFYAICHPLSFKSTPRRAKVMIVVTWVLALLMAIPDLICLDTQRNEGLPDDFYLLVTCKPTWSDSIQVGVQCFNLLVMYLLPLGFMFGTYFRIVRCLWSTNIPTESSSDQLHSKGNCTLSAAAENQLKGRRNAAKMLIAVVLMFCICYLPVHLLNILGYANALDVVGEYITILALMSHWLSYLNSAINPVIYNYMSTKFRQEFKHACNCCCNKDTQRGISPRSGASTFAYKYSNAIARTSRHAMTSSAASTKE